MHEIPLTTMVIPFGNAQATNNVHNIEKMTHVSGDDKNAVPKYHKIPTPIQSNKISNKNKLTDLLTARRFTTYGTLDCFSNTTV